MDTNKIITTAEDARAYAIEWQHWQAEQNLSYGELLEWQNYFDGLATQWPELADEFRTNGII